MFILVSGGIYLVKWVVWCIGGVQGYIEKVVVQGVDVYISGEILEQIIYIVCECGIYYYSVGYYVIECYGVKVVGEYLEVKFQLNYKFIDIGNLV